MCFLMLSLLLPSDIQADEVSLTTTVIAVGTSTIYNEDVASARSHAISNSLVSALSQTISDFLTYDTITADFHVLNTLLYNRTKEYVQDYKVLNSSRIGKQYSVIVAATVSTGSVKAQLSSVGLQLSTNAMPNVLFFIVEKDFSNPEPKYWWKDNQDASSIYAENMMSISMQDREFSVIDHRELTQDAALKTILNKPHLNKEEAIAFGGHFGADVVIVGAATVQETANTIANSTRSYKAEISANAFRTDTGKQIGTTLQSFISVGEDDFSGGADALSGVGRLAGTDLSEKISTAWLEKQQVLSGIEIYIKWAGNLSQLVELRKALAALPGVMGIFPREMSTIEAVIGVDYKGDEKELAESLIAKTYSSFRINIYEISDRHLSLQILPI